MLASCILLVAHLFAFPAYALDQEDICRTEIFRTCEEKARAKLLECNTRQLTSDAVTCEPLGLNACDAEAKQAACGGTFKPEEQQFIPRVVFAPQIRQREIPIAPTNVNPAQSRPTQQPPTNQNATPTVASPTPQDSGTAQSEASADVAQCHQLQSEAARCCGNPLACASPAQVQRASKIQQQVKDGPSPGQSIPNYCAQLGQLSSDSGDYNADMASVCFAPQRSCSSTCQSLAQKYSSRASDCNGSTCSIFQGAADQLSSLASNCDSLSSQVSRWSSQGISTAGPQAGSSLCSNQNYSAQSAGGALNQKQNALNHQAQSANGGLANDPCMTSPGSQACATCSVNPASPQCQEALAKPEQQADVNGTSGYSSVHAASESGGFNPSNMQDLSSLNASMNMGTDTGAAAVNATTHVIANNTGGGITGGSGSAKMDAGGKKTAPTANGNVADIMQGNRSGGGYLQQAANDKNNNDNQFGGYRASGSAKRGPSSVANGNGYLGMDLKKWLPGGANQPFSGIAGLDASMEINGKSADLFKKVSTKIEEKCRLGLLFECR